jgi:hypothetical protein
LEIEGREVPVRQLQNQLLFTGDVALSTLLTFPDLQGKQIQRTQLLARNPGTRDIGETKKGKTAADSAFLSFALSILHRRPKNAEIPTPLSLPMIQGGSPRVGRISA